MPALTDGSFGTGSEVTFGTPVTPTRWYEPLPGTMDFNINPAFTDGGGMRVASVVDRADRSVITTADATGGSSFELLTRGYGLLWEACLGAATSTLVSGSTYQQVITPISSSSTLPARTVQVGVVDATGTVNPFTFEGGTVSEWTLSMDNAGLVTLEVQWDFENWSTATGLTTPTYTASANQFHFGQATIGIGGAYTHPTTTALGAAATTVSNVRAFSITCNNNVDAGRYNATGTGRKQRQLAGKREITGSVEYEYDANTNRDNFIANTSTPLVLTLTSSEALSTGTATFQVCIPNMKWRAGTPQQTDGPVPTVSGDFKVFENGTNPAVALVHRTADTAL
jgi:hypothetical protein